MVVGRNEGERLRRCVGALPLDIRRVYVDSGSADSSLDTARGLGAEAVALDPDGGFSAARGRNTGFRLIDSTPAGAPEFVQFVDGDCELRAGWLERAADELSRRPDLAIVCGVLREHDRDSSVFRRLCDMEWRRPIGPMSACGGIFMVRSAAFRQVAGFDERLVVGEEADLCRRVIAAGWKLVRLDAPMATHDSGMSRFGHWWSRSVRGGYAYALSASADPSGRAFVRERWRAWLWSFVVPLVAVAAAWPTHGWSLVILLLYPLRAFRIAWRRRYEGESATDRLLYGAACVVAQAPQLLGQLRYWIERVRGRRHRVIEYRRPVSAAPQGSMGS